MIEKLEQYFEAKGWYTFEGRSGVQRFETVMHEVCGYGSYSTMDSFFEDNSGAIAAVIDWIGNARVEMWEANLDEQLELFGTEQE